MKKNMFLGLVFMSFAFEVKCAGSLGKAAKSLPGSSSGQLAAAAAKGRRVSSKTPVAKRGQSGSLPKTVNDENQGADAKSATQLSDRNTKSLKVLSPEEESEQLFQQIAQIILNDNPDQGSAAKIENEVATLSAVNAVVRSLNGMNAFYKNQQSKTVNSLQLVIVTPAILKQQPSILRFVGISALFNLMIQGHGEATGSDVVDKYKLTEFVINHSDVFAKLIETNAISMAKSQNQPLMVKTYYGESKLDENVVKAIVKVALPLYQNWTEICARIEKSINPQLPNNLAYLNNLPTPVQGIVNEMMLGASQLTKQVEKAQDVSTVQSSSTENPLKRLEPTAPVLMLLSQEVMLLIQNKEAKNLLDFVANPLTGDEQSKVVEILEDVLGVPASTKLPAIENNENGENIDRDEIERQNYEEFERIIEDFKNQELKKQESMTQRYVPVSSEWMNKVASTAHKIASSFVDKQMITEEDLMKVLQNKNLYFEELSNSQNMAYMMGYLQSFVWNLQGGNDKNNVKKLTKIVEIVRNLQGRK